MHLLCNISCTDDVKCRFKNSVFALTHVIYFVALDVLHFEIIKSSVYLDSDHFYESYNKYKPCLLNSKTTFIRSPITRINISKKESILKKLLKVLVKI